MSAFQYTAIDQNGKKHKGVLEADSERQVRQQLRDKSAYTTRYCKRNPTHQNKTRNTIWIKAPAFIYQTTDTTHTPNGNTTGSRYSHR